MCRGCRSDNNQTNITFQIWGAGIIPLGVVAVVVWVFCVGLMIWMVAVVVKRGGDGDDENNKTVKMAEMVREVVDNRNRW
jgi:hypothetical protein